MNPSPEPSFEISPLARQLATQANLTDPAALTLIECALQAHGVNKMQLILEDARADAKEGGLEARDGTHLHQVGAIFLYHTYTFLPAAQRQTLPPPPGHRVTPLKPVAPKPPPVLVRSAATPPVPVTAPAAASTPPDPAAPAKPKGATAKMTLVGRPTKIEPQKEYVALTFTTGPLPDLPKGLPTPPTSGSFTALVALKKWNKVAAALDNPDDVLIVEGYGAQDPATKKLLLFAANVTTKLQQQALKQKQQAEAAATAPLEKNNVSISPQAQS